MIWPSPQDYNEAVQTAEISFNDAELRNSTVELNQLELPRPISGHFASVYRMHCPSRDVAVRCFLHGISDHRKRYEIISDFCSNVDLPFTVGFDYIEEGIRIRQQWYPILKMEWIDGLTLNRYIESNLENREQLESLAVKFTEMINLLGEAGIAHGDLQHGNILVVDHQLRLVDYDGMYVPALVGWQSNELGHRNYQHPKRTREHFGAYLDNIPARVILTSLISLAKQPSLWNQLGCSEERLLFSSTDLQSPGRSNAFATLRRSGDEQLVIASQELHKLLLTPVDQVPPLGAFVDVSDLSHNNLPEWIEPSQVLVEEHRKMSGAKNTGVRNVEFQSQLEEIVKTKKQSSNRYLAFGFAAILILGLLGSRATIDPFQTFFSGLVFGVLPLFAGIDLRRSIDKAAPQWVRLLDVAEPQQAKYKITCADELLEVHLKREQNTVKIQTDQNLSDLYSSDCEDFRPCRVYEDEGAFLVIVLPDGNCVFGKDIQKNEILNA